MKKHLGVFNTNLVNKSKMICPASALMDAEEEHYLLRKSQNISIGMPSNIAHDMHRPIGWTQPLGLYIDGEMVRVLGSINCPENDEEKQALNCELSKYWKEFHRNGYDQYGIELLQKLSLVSSSEITFYNLEAYSIKKTNVASDVYPQFFNKSDSLVDKDGLVDYRSLLESLTEVQPGVFHDKNKDLILFAHRFYRRRLSHFNKLNDYFLSTFKNVAQNESITSRIKLDPDILGHPASVRNIIELEYWHGPKFNENISKIPSGVTEHKADSAERFYEGIDKTQFWWKSTEARVKNSNYRTFEAEELIENESIGVSKDYYGCRYVHAEFSEDSNSITHFDGAIRGYNGEDYLNRIELSIDKAGKNADYTKLFRLDGNISIDIWKRLMSDFYKGNKLILEYLDIKDSNSLDTHSGEDPLELNPHNIDLISLISINEFPKTTSSTEILQELYIKYNNKPLPYIEIGNGQVANFLKSQLDLTTFATISFDDGILNLSRICFRDINPIDFYSFTSHIGSALLKDAKSNNVKLVSIPITWLTENIGITLTVAGNAEDVADILQKLPSIINPGLRPSKWIEALDDAIKAITSNSAPILWGSIERGLITIPRSGQVSIEMSLPEHMKLNLP
jgi:hypothetical protein